MVMLLVTTRVTEMVKAKKVDTAISWCEYSMEELMIPMRRKTVMAEGEAGDGFGGFEATKKRDTLSRLGL